MTPGPIIAITPGDGRALLPWVQALAGAGLPTLLLREPGLDRAALAACVEVARAADVQVLLHDKHPDARALAQQHGLGLHLASGADPADARALTAGPLGVSCHSLDEVDAALAAGADYALLSPVFKPTSRPLDTRPALGPAQFLSVAAGRPIWALGGVNAQRWAVLRRGGATGAAVLGDLFSAETPAASALRLADYLGA